MAAVLQGARAGGPGCWPTTTRWSTGPPPTGPASAGGARTPTCCCPALGSWYVLGSVVTDAPVAGRRRARSPTGAARAPGASTAAPRAPSPRRASSTPAAACRGCCRPRAPFPLEHRVALGDRIYGCDECQEVCPPNRRAAVPRADRGRASRGSPLLALLDADDAVVLERAGRWYIPRARGPLRPPQRARGARQRRRRPTIRRWSRRCGAHLAHDDPLLRGHAVWAARRLGREDLLADLVGADDPLVARRAGGSVRPAADDPPLRHQRLPAQDRRHPDDALGAVAAARPVDVRRCSPRRTRTPRRGTPSSRSASCAPASRCCCPRRRCAAQIDALAAEVGADRVVLDPALPVGLLGPRLRPARTPSCSTAPRSPCPAGCPVSNQLLRPRAARRRARRSAPAATRWPRASRAAGRALPGVLVPPGVDTERFRPLDAGRAAPRRAPASACPSTARSW